MPLTAPESTSVTLPEINVETRSPLLVVWSSLIVLKSLAPERTGASFTLVTVMFEVAVAVLKAVVPLLTVVSTFVPCVPLVWSQAQNVTLAVVPLAPSGTKRSLSLERNSKADELLTAPTPVQVVPASVEYCHVPLLLTRLVTAIPLTAPLSTSVTFPEINVETRSPELVVWSSLIVVKLLAPERTGASFTLVTVIFDVAVAVLKAVVPPLTVVSTLVPCVPLVWSQAQNVTLAVVPLAPSGTKRSLSVERNNRADELLTAPTPVQVVPASVEYCHVPVLLFNPVTAIPLMAPLSTSLTLPEI